MMRVALFCATDIGVEVARLVAAAGKAVVCGVFNSAAGVDELDELRQTWADVPTCGSDTLKEPAGIDLLRRLEPDLIVLAWWPYLLPAELVRLPKAGCLNFHPSLLPHNRGKHPNFWALVEGRPFGVSIHWLADKIDAGPVAFQRSIPTDWTDTGGTLHARAKADIVRLFADNMDRIWAGDIPRLTRDLAAGSFHLGKELGPASEIDLNRTYTGRELLNLLRARTYPPYPAAWFADAGGQFEVRVDIRRRDV